MTSLGLPTGVRHRVLVVRTVYLYVDRMHSEDESRNNLE